MTQERPLLEEMTLRQLRRVASEYNISRYSRMRKSQLLASIEQAIQENNQNKTLLTNITYSQEEKAVEASKFELGQDDKFGGPFTSVDENLGDFPGGYGESRIVLMPRDPQWAYAYWDIPNEQKNALRSQGGQQLALRLYDVTDVNLNYQSPHSVQEYLCDELAREWYLPIPVSDRDYAVDIGYRTFDGRWLVLARSIPVRIPPVYPSDWVEDVFITVNWDEELKGRTLYNLVPPSKRAVGVGNAIHDQVYDLAQSAEAQRMAGSLYGSMQQVPGSIQHVAGSVQHVAGSVQHVAGSIQQVAGSIQQVPSYMQHVAGSVQHVAGSVQQIPSWMQHVAGSVQHVAGSIQHEQTLSSYIFPSGVGMWAAPNVSGLNMSGIGLTASGAGFMASEAPIRPRQFWLVADAELIVYGATEPDATVTIGGRPIKLNPDGTFRFQMSFQDGLIDYPIMAVAADGEQTRSIHMKFNRETPSRRTNTKEEAVLEWPV